MNTFTKILIVLCLEAGVLFGQTQEKPTSIWDQAASKASQPDNKGKEDSGQRVNAIPMEGPVDPAQYVVGPFDMFTLAFWGVPPLEYTVPVTPEGTILIPTVGEVRIADLTLAKAKSRVAEAVERKYRPGSFTMTLVRPRNLIVTLRGAVSRPGQYVASAIERVEKIILEGASDIKTPTTTFTIPALTATGLPVFQEDFRVPKIKALTELDEETSTRNIKLIRRSGDTIRVDLPKYYATLDNKYNPFLVDGDIIMVPSKLLSTNFVSVHGAVNAPGRFEFVEGDSLLGLINIAGGLLATADHQATIYRSERSGGGGQEITVDLDAILSRKTPDVPIQRGDRVLVKHQVDKRRDFYVTIGGEVASPGEYPITRESTKLSEVLRSAGGITSKALLSSSVIWRKDDKYTIPDASQLDYLSFMRAHQFGMIDSTYFFLDLKVGRQPVGVDFKGLLVNKDTACDVTLRHQDFIYIATDEHSVLVQGQVSNPGYFAYVPGADYRDYIREAGDYQDRADESGVRIIKGGTLSWFKPGDTSIESGDRIWVPKKSTKDFYYYLTIARDIATLLISTTTLILVARQSK